MNRILLCVLSAVLLTGTTSLGQQPRNQCENCDCTYWPWPKDCNRCCKRTKGKIIVSKNDMLIVKSAQGAAQEFKLTPETKTRGTLEPGQRAIVNYKVSLEDKIPTADAVTVVKGGQDTGSPN